MLQIKPHTVVIKRIAQAIGSDNVVQNPHGGTTVSITGLLEQVSEGEVLREYEVELKNGARFWCEVGDAAKFGPDYEVSYSGAVYRCVGMPLVRSAGTVADHAVVLLEFKQYGALP